MIMHNDNDKEEKNYFKNFFIQITLILFLFCFKIDKKNNLGSGSELTQNSGSDSKSKIFGSTTLVTIHCCGAAHFRLGINFFLAAPRGMEGGEKC